jgi:TolB-like protein
MSYSLKQLAFWFTIFTCVIVNFAQEPEKLRIAILDFNNTGGLSKQETVTLGNRLNSMLVKTDAFIVLERGKMDDILDEQGFQQTGCTTTECAVEMGELLNVEKMISGSIGKLGQTYTIDLSLIDVKTARIEKSFFRDFKGEIDGLLNLMQLISNQIAEISGGTPASPLTAGEQVNLRITSDPEGAKVFIDNKEAGNTPYRGKVRKGMTVNLRVEKENYKNWQKTLTVNEDVEVEAELAYTEAYKKATGADEGGMSTWVWIGGGAVLVGGAAVLLMSGGGDGTPPEEGDQGFPVPPGRP